MGYRDHWERVYAARPVEQLGWYRPQLEISLSWIRELGLAADAPIIDIGGGASTLSDDLLEAGHRAIIVLDISAAAVAAAKARLGERAERVTWLIGDVTAVELPTGHVELWHDRAMFHFLTEPEQRRLYRDSLLRALRPGGHLVIGTFAPEAPARCSGLPVQRYDAQQLAEELGAVFELRRHRKELHVTPGGVEQMYLYCLFRRNDP